ncbi:hypothetical protein [Actinomadura nitritigenes]|uniref:WXG100 family type VII secretion target n=1 Tax=Actinomadura nitritigenes TaxID=134602 RepID=UPI003D8A5BDA
MTLHPYERGIRPGSLGHGDPAQYDYLTIKSFFANAEPADLEGLQQAYTNLQSALQDLERRFGQHTKRLNQIWDGVAQQAGASEIKQLSENAATLAQASAQFGTAMSSGAAALRNPPQIPPPSGPGGALPGLIGEAAASPADTKAAQEALAKTNTSLASAFNQIPARLALGIAGNKNETPYSGGAPAPGTPGGAVGGGGASGSGGASSGTGVPFLGTAESDRGGSATTQHSPYGSKNPSSPKTIGIPSGEPGASSPAPSVPPGHHPSDLEGSAPHLGAQPGGAPGSPSPTQPMTDGRNPGPGPGRIPPSVGGGLPLPPAGEGTPPRPEPGGGVPSRPNRMMSRGVLGGTGFKGVWGVGEEPLGSYGTGSGPRQLPAGGVLRNGVLRPSAEATGMPIPEARPGAVGTGFPMTGATGGGGRTGERSRDISLIEDDDLWRDETAVSPRVIGKRDQAFGDSQHGS